MKVLVLLLGAIAITEASHWAKVKREAEELRNTVDQDDINMQLFDGEFGVMRKMRLQKIADHFNKQHINQTEKDSEAIKLFSENFVPADMSSSLPAHDPYSLNKAAGISEYLYHGDILLTNEQLDAIERQLEDTDENGRSKRQASSVLKKWTNNRVYYFFHKTATDRIKNVVRPSLRDLQSKTCLIIQESSTAANRIVIWPGSGCFASIGMIGGEQQLSLGQGCTLAGTVLHEFYHSLGVWHMQARSDRDRYVTINLATVPQGLKFNFDKLKASEEINYTPYEYGSAMHYSADSFSDRKTMSMTPRDPTYLRTIGSSFLSFYDIDMINEHYGCNAKCPKSSICKNGGKPNPANCNICNCPGGYGGYYCDQRPTGCGSTLAATTTWKNETLKLGRTHTENFRDIPDVCNYWITASTGYKIEVKVTKMFNSQCNYGCTFQGIEFKTKDQLATNPRYCCPEDINKSQVSKLNPTPVFLYNHYEITEFTFSYRAVPGTAAEPVQQQPMD